MEAHRKADETLVGRDLTVADILISDEYNKLQNRLAELVEIDEKLTNPRQSTKDPV